jgi:hypothetical protein
MTLRQQHLFNEGNLIICKSCFWCASFLNRYRIFNVCPSCMNSGVESTSISYDEKYTFDYDRCRGVTLEFWSTNNSYAQDEQLCPL